MPYLYFTYLVYTLAFIYRLEENEGDKVRERECEAVCICICVYFQRDSAATSIHSGKLECIYRCYFESEGQISRRQMKIKKIQWLKAKKQLQVNNNNKIFWSPSSYDGTFLSWWVWCLPGWLLGLTKLFDEDENFIISCGFYSHQILSQQSWLNGYVRKRSLPPSSKWITWLFDSQKLEALMQGLGHKD